MAGPFDTAKQGFFAQSGRFWQIDWNGVVIGGCQSVSYSEHTGVRGFVGEIGSDWKDPDFDMRQVSGSVNRLTLNKKKIRDLFANGDASTIDLDFRDYLFTLTMTYNAVYPQTNGTKDPTPPPNAPNGSGPFLEVIHDVMFTDLSFSLGGPYTLSQETVSFIGKYIGAKPFSESSLQQS